MSCASTETADELSSRGIGSEEFRSTMSRWATGVSVITAFCGGGPVGLISNSFTSVSLEPPLVSWCLDRRSSSFDAWLDADAFAVHVLAAGQEEMVSRFSRRGGDKFQGLDWVAGRSGAPLLDGAVATFQCGVHARYKAGDHVILLGLVTDTSQDDLLPMLYVDGAIRAS
ncbi:flavin reductase family protein [Streptomyces shenzhenensis]|uniref:flavin reductase family protein n=1 Tax=Streptomyces shenzhenensis TaxID=943815 RepID=UPI00382A9346